MFTQAYATAMTSTHKFQHACVVIRGGKPVAIDANINYGHAEVRALEKIRPLDRRKCSVFSLRFAKSGKLQNAKPCVECQKYMRANGIRFAWYSNAAGKIQKMFL